MPLEEYTLKKNTKVNTEVAEKAGDLLAQIAQNSVDSHEFRIGGKSEGKFTVTGSDSGSTGLSSKISATEEGVGVFNKNKIDHTDMAQSLLDASRSTYNQTDFAAGTSATRKYGRLLGAGSLSKMALEADLHAYLHDRNKWETTSVSSAMSRSKVTGLETMSSRSRIYDTYSMNSRRVDEYLRSQGINTNGMSVKDIDRMIGAAGKHSYGNPSSFHANESVVFTGGVRDKFSAIGDDVLRRNKGNTGGKNGIDIDDATRIVLQEQRNQMKMQPKVAQARNQFGGAKKVVANWATTAAEDTDTASGYRYAKGVQMGARATALVSETGAAAVGKATVRSIEATGRISAAAAKGGMNVAGAVYARGDAVRRQRWKQLTEGAMRKADKVSSMSKAIGDAGSEGISKAWSKSVQFTNSKTTKKISVISQNVGKANKWVVQKTIGRTKVGQRAGEAVKKATKPFKAIKAFGGKVSTRLGGIHAAFAAHTKFLRLPFTGLNALKAMGRKAILTIAAGFLLLILIVVVVLTLMMAVTSILPDTFLADQNDATTDNVGNMAIEAMLAVQNDFLDEVEQYMNDHCDLEDEDGNPLHPSHNAYFNLYMGDNTDVFGNLASPPGNSSNCALVNGGSQPYNISVLYKTIISMATVATGNETEDGEFYSEYCCLLLKKILHQASITDNEDGTVAIDLKDVGLTDAMVLDASEIECNLSESAEQDEDWTISNIFNYNGCGRRFEIVENNWMHRHGHDSLEYSVSRRSSQYYNWWNGWASDPTGPYDWAMNLWELGNEDWEQMDIQLPGFVGGGDNGAAMSPTTVLNTIEALRDAGYSEERIQAIMIAMNEVGQHTYGVRNDSEDISYRTDCSGFISGVLMSAGLLNQHGSCQWLVGNVPHTTELVPGTLMVKNNTAGRVENGQVRSSNHVVMYLGAVEGYGDYCVVECSTKYTYVNGIRSEYVDGVSISGFNTLAQMQARYPYSYYLNPYGD